MYSRRSARGGSRVRALRGVDLTLRAGEVTLIRGPSGSGKTTLLHILGLLLRAESGEVWIEGRRLDTLPESRLADERRGRVVLIFQQQNLLLSVGSLDAIRLRAEIDEADIARVFVGQSVVATAQSLNDREITGTVVRLEPIMGRKSIRTERAAEQRDTKVREVLIQLAPDTPTLPIDLQLTVRFIGKPMPTATTNTPNRE